MKKKLLALLSLFLALVVFVSPFSCCLDNVYAASSFSPSSSFSKEDTISILEAFYNNQSVINLGFTPDNSYFACTALSSNNSGYLLCMFKEDAYTSNFTYSNVSYTGLTCDSSDHYIWSWGFPFSSVSSIQSANFSYYSSAGYRPVIYDRGSAGYMVSRLWQGGIDNPYPNSNFYSYIFDDGTFNSYSPDFSGLLVGFPVAFQFNEQDFYNWIIDNNKLSELPSYITSSKLLSFLKFYKNFGSSNTSFVTRIVSWFSHMNIANQSNENIVILKNAIDKLYQEYINQYKHEFYSNSANQAHHRRNIQTQTDDDDLTLVTDDQTDDIYTKLLREIIRGIIALQVTVSEGHRAIIDTLNNLDFTVAVSNNGGDFKFPNLEDLFTPTYSGFDDLEDQFFEKFPFLLDLQELPEIEDYLEAQEQGDNLQVAALSAGSEAVEADPLKTRDDLFRFTVPENNIFMNGAVSGMSIDFASFTKFAPAIEALKGIISVIALFGFSHWLIKFAPKLLHGYASSD